MRMILAGLCLALWSGTAWSQTTDTARWILPSPASVVLEIGRWIVQDRDQLYQVTVQGMGQSQDQALDQALRLAVTQAVGSVILTENTVDRTQQQIVDAQLVNHSSGVVDRFEILRTTTDPQGRIVVDMRVWVRRSRLADGVFSARTNTARIPGPQIAATVSSESRQRQTSTALVQAAVKGFPEQSFRVSVDKYAWQMTGAGQARLDVDLTVEWNRDWLSRFHRALMDASGIDSNNDCYYDLRQCREKGLVFVVFRSGHTAYAAKSVAAWQDAVNFTTVHQALMSQTLSLRVDLRAGGKSAQVRCYQVRDVRSPFQPNAWFGLLGSSDAERRFPWDPPPQGLEIWTRARIPVSVVVPALDEQVIKHLDNVEIALVRTLDCR